MILLLALFLLLTCSIHAAQIVIKVKAPWNSSLLAEAFEFYSFDSVSLLASLPTSLSTEPEELAAILSFTRKTYPDLEVLLNLTLSTRMLAPRVVSSNPNIKCTSTAIQCSTTTEWICRDTEKDDCSVTAVAGDIRDFNTRSLIQSWPNAHVAHSIKATQSTVWISGYGVDLMIKNVEYKSMDDSKQAGNFIWQC